MVEESEGINMEPQEKICVRCNKTFTTNTNVAKYCPGCRKAAYRDAVMFSKLRRKRSKESKSMIASARVTGAVKKLHGYSDEKFYVEVTKPILKQLGDMEAICKVLDAYAPEDRVRIVRELLDRLTGVTK